MASTAVIQVTDLGIGVTGEQAGSEVHHYGLELVVGIQAAGVIFPC